MNEKYYNSEKFELTIKMVNDCVIIVAQTLNWSPKIILVSKENNQKDFELYTNFDFLECVESDAETFNTRLYNVANLAAIYPR